VNHYVYIVSNRNRTVYVGMTSDLTRRVDQHKNGTFENAFTKRYNFDRLVYFEEAATGSAAAKREKQIKGWTYAKKVALIESVNPEWKDLCVDWNAIFR
jgi:putative endonuclease